MLIINKIIFLCILILLITGCARDRGHWECMVYNAATNTIMTEEEYKQWTKDNNVEYIPPSNSGNYVSFPSSQPHVLPSYSTPSYYPYWQNYIPPSAYYPPSVPAVSQDPQPVKQQPRRQRASNTSTKAKNYTKQQSQQPSVTTVAQNPLDNLYNSAVQGNPQAQYELGITFINRGNSIQNYNTGVQWLRKSAMQGYQPAREALIKLYQGK